MKEAYAVSTVDLEFLCRLSEDYPVECASLLGSMSLNPVRLTDDVVPFRLPTHFCGALASRTTAESLAKANSGNGAQNKPNFSDQKKEDEDPGIDASLMALSRTWLTYAFAFWFTVGNGFCPRAWSCACLHCGCHQAHHRGQPVPHMCITAVCDLLNAVFVAHLATNTAVHSGLKVGHQHDKERALVHAHDHPIWQTHPIPFAILQWMISCVAS